MSTAIANDTAKGVEVVRGASQAVVMLKPPRPEILEQLREPDSASGLARRMGLPRQRLNHHLRELERAGLLELVEERRKGNCIERVMRSVARYYLISPEALGAVGADRPEGIRDRFSWSYLTAVAGKALRDLAILRRRADSAGKRLATFTLETEVRFASAKARHAFAEELTNEVARMVAKYHDDEAPRGRRFRFFLGGHPRITTKGGGPDGARGKRPKEKRPWAELKRR